MDFRMVLVNAIGLLFWESSIPSLIGHSSGLVKEILKNLPSPDSMVGNEDDRENTIYLRDLANKLTTVTEPVNRKLLMRNLQVSIRNDPELLDAIKSLFDSDLSEEEIDACINETRKELSIFFQQKDFKEKIRKIAQKTIFSGADTFNVGDMARAIIADLEPFVNYATQDDEDPNLNSKGDTGNIDEIIDQLTMVQEDLDPASAIKTGWQAFNRMLGEAGGLRRGNMYVLGAMPNKGKSYMTSCITLHSMLFNQPYLFDETKKPAVVHISTENDVALNLKIWFRYLWENIEGKECDISSMDPAFMAQWFVDKIQANGHRFFFYYINPSQTDYHWIISKMMEIESMGYEISLAAIDYLAMITNEGLGDDNRAVWIQQLFKVMRNYANPRKITLITPHQVATDAAMLLRQGSDDFVKQIAGKRYWANCRSIDMEVDCEILVNVEQDSQKNSWMSIGRGKDRSSLNTPEIDKFFFLPFDKIGGLRPDIDSKDTSKRSIKADAMMVDVDWMMNGSNDDDM